MSRITRIILVVFALSWIGKEIILPIVAAALYSIKYMEQVYDCDTAMESSWFYKQDETISSESEIIQLLDCHEYDKSRKIMLISGLPEVYLSWLGLKSLELYQRSPEEFVEQHRFKKK